MKKMLPIFLAQCRESRTQQHELYRIEEVRLARSISTHDHIVLRAKRFYLRLVSETSEPADYYLLNVHL